MQASTRGMGVSDPENVAHERWLITVPNEHRVRAMGQPGWPTPGWPGAIPGEDGNEVQKVRRVAIISAGVGVLLAAVAAAAAEAPQVTLARQFSMSYLRAQTGAPPSGYSASTT